MLKQVTNLWVSVLTASLAIAIASPAQADGLKLLPSDTEMVISVNLKQVWNSKLVKDYGALIKQIEGFINTKIDDNQIAGEFKKTLGVDLFKEVDLITIGTSEWGPKPKNAVVIFEGKFNQDKFTETNNKAAKDTPEEIKALTIANQTVYQKNVQGGESFYLAMTDKNTLILSRTKEGVTAAISPPAQNLKKELANLMQKANPKKSLNFVVTANAIQEGINAGNPQAQAFEKYLKGLDGVVMTANVVSDIELHVGFQAKDAASAKKLEEEVNKGVGALKALIGNKAEAAPVAAILKSLKVSAVGTTMSVDGAVPRELVDEAMKKIENFLP